jgi:phosphoglycerate dehydrogenase-like enzyme
MLRVALLDDYQGVALRMADWASLAPRARIDAFSDHIADRDALAERLLPYDCVMLMRERTQFPRALFERLPNLRLLVTAAMWNVAIDLEAASAHGVQVCGTGDVSDSTPELTLGLMLGLSRRIAQEDRAVRAGQWQTTLGAILKGKVLGVLGLGILGTKVAALGRALGMEVIAWSANLTAERAREAGATRVEKEALLERADMVTIHLKLSDRTRGLITARDLARMKPSAYLVNTSRGPIVEEAALIAALRERRIAGAGLDVFDHEPLPLDHPFRTLDNVLITPHIGYVSEENYRLIYGDTLEDIRAFLDGRVVRAMNRPASSASSTG